MCVCRCSPMRSCRIINSGSSSVGTREVEVLYKKQQGLKHTHTLLATMGPAPSHRHMPPTPLQHLFLSCPNTSLPFLFLWSFHPTIPLSHHSPPLYIILTAHREPSLSRQTPLSPMALPRLKLKSFSSLLSTASSSSSSPGRRAEWRSTRGD